jgi:putative membrane protein
MFELSADGYLWVKALHLISVISWMAGLLYLPRLFVYHTGAEQGTKQSDTFVIMERRLLNAIMAPAMVASLVTGGLLLGTQGSTLWNDGWWLLKAFSLAGLLVCHGLMIGWYRGFAAGRNTRSHKFFRMMNEIPTVLMIVIVISVVVKPF